MRFLLNYSWYRRNTLIITHVLLAVGVILSLVGFLYVARENHRLASNTHHAVCTLRADLIQRRAASVAFLKIHPNGFLGFTKRDLQRSIANQTLTIQSLSVADCEGS